MKNGKEITSSIEQLKSKMWKMNSDGGRFQTEIKDTFFQALTGF